MTSTAPNEDVKEKISCKLVSEIIRDRIKSDGTRFHANDNISKYILLSRKKLRQELENYSKHY